MLYDLAIVIYDFIVHLAAPFSRKPRKMMKGHWVVYELLRQQVEKGEQYIWFHAASLGEFEQGRPLIEMIRAKYPNYKILLTFFSPSGYEVRKHYRGADIVCYLPFDKPRNVKKFLDIANPCMAFFIKYEFWKNYLDELHKRRIPVYSVSSIFRREQIFFKWYGGTYRNVLKDFDHLFVQNEASKRYLSKIGISRVTVVGDTRFDRVLQIREEAKELPLVEKFKGTNSFTFVAGSSWGPDEDLFLEYFNNHPEMKLIIAPHVIDENHLVEIISKLKRPYVRYTRADERNVLKADCLIIDCFGLLSSIYRYGEIAYIGGGIYSQLPKKNDELAAADKVMGSNKKRGKQVLNVNAKVIKPQSLTDEFTTTGVLLPDEEVDLSFETSGKIVEINFEEGTAVKKGQLLAKVNDRQLQAQLQRLISQLKLAEDRVFRQDALLKRDAVSKEAYEQVKTDLATLNADIEIIKANIELTELRAPFDGVIGLRQVSIGTYASPTTVVAKLTKIAPLKVEFSVPERYAKQIKKGTNLNFSVEGTLDAFGAQVYAVESAIDPNLHQFTARALYPNVNRTLLPGRYASVLLKKDEIPNAIAIPTEAIVPEMGKDKVYLYKSGKAEPVDIITGIRTASEVQVIRGLHVGDTIITSGTLQLRTGLAVTLDNIEE